MEDIDDEAFSSRTLYEDSDVKGKDIILVEQVEKKKKHNGEEIQSVTIDSQK